MVGDDFWKLLGLHADAVRAYESFLTDPDQRADARRVGLAISDKQWDAAVAALTEARLLRWHDGQLVPVDARAVLPGLARSRQAILDQVGGIADDLGARLAAARRHADPATVVTVLRGGSEVVQTVLNAYESAAVSVVGTVAPPYVAGGDTSLLSAERALIARGVSFRSIYDSDVLETGSYQQHVWAAIDAGEEARVMPGMRLKLLIVDGTTAIVPLAPSAEAGEPIALQLSASALTEALQQLFELLWAAATPLGPRSSNGPSANAEQLERLLLGGMTDTAIAHALGISERTFRRRITDLYTHYGVTNRVQLGAAIGRDVH